MRTCVRTCWLGAYLVVGARWSACFGFEPRDWLTFDVNVRARVRVPAGGPDRPFVDIGIVLSCLSVLLLMMMEKGTEREGRGGAG